MNWGLLQEVSQVTTIYYICIFYFKCQFQSGIDLPQILTFACRVKVVVLILLLNYLGGKAIPQPQTGILQTSLGCYYWQLSKRRTHLNLQFYRQKENTLIQIV